jgi:hypothetical protein
MLEKALIAVIQEAWLPSLELFPGALSQKARKTADYSRARASNREKFRASRALAVFYGRCHRAL